MTTDPPSMMRVAVLHCPGGVCPALVEPASPRAVVDVRGLLAKVAA